MTSQPTLKTDLQGAALLDDPTFNKGTAFSREERKAFGINAYLPYQVHTLEEQKKRAWQQYSSRSDDLARNTFLTSLRDQNTVLYFALLQDHIREVMPVIYTPTEGEAIANYSRLFRRPEGLFLSFPNSETMEEDVLRYVHEEGRTNNEVDLIVVSDGEQILGIGDQGVGGSAGITTAKAAVYTLCAGIDPARTIAVGLDVGTDNQKLLDDELYVGWRNKRVRGGEYDAFVGKFADLVKQHFPNALLHFEDFGLTNALRLLEKYRPEQSVFNDDIQGTAAISLAAILAACKATGTKLTDQRFVIHGAGTAGLGIAGQIKSAIRHLEGSKSDAEASKLFWLVDKGGLLHEGLSSSSIRDAAKPYVRASSEIDAWDVPSSQDSGDEAKKIRLADVVKNAKPTVLIGVSTQGGAFTADIVRCMAKHSEHPVILPLSNPTKLCEVDPRDAYKWSNGKALLATGSPFPPAKLDDDGEEYEIAECNNALVYPGLGLGTIVSQASRLTDGMIVAGIEAVAALAPCAAEGGKTSSALLPPFVDARRVSKAVAVAVARKAVEEGVAQGEGKKALEESMEDEGALERYVESRMWKAEYRPLELVSASE